MNLDNNDQWIEKIDENHPMDFKDQWGEKVPPQQYVMINNSQKLTCNKVIGLNKNVGFSIQFWIKI